MQGQLFGIGEDMIEVQTVCTDDNGTGGAQGTN